MSDEVLDALDLEAACERKDAEIATLRAEVERIKNDPAFVEYKRMQAEVERLKDAAKAVCWFDWSDNDSDAVQAVENLRALIGEPPRHD